MILDEIIDHKRREVADTRQRTPLSAFKEHIAARETGLFKKAIKVPDRLCLIAEVKKASPSRGLLCDEFDPVRLARVYAQSGASAVSVLTDSRYFQGDIAHLQAARESSGLPVLRKDFIIDEYQLYESAAIGADAALLIVAALSDEQLREYIQLARELGMDTLVEVHDEGQLETALEAGAEIVGINNRDLRTFKTGLDATLRLAPEVPPDHAIVSESGIRSAEDARRVRDAGAHAILVGEALVTSEDIPGKIRELIGGQG